MAASSVLTRPLTVPAVQTVASKVEVVITRSLAVEATKVVVTRAVVMGVVLPVMAVDMDTMAMVVEMAVKTEVVAMAGAMVCLQHDNDKGSQLTDC